MKVTILDDSRTDSYLAGKVAGRFFSDVVICGTPHEFRESMKGSLPELILLDVHIGDMHNGINILDEIRTSHSEASIVPIVVLTSSNDERIHKHAMECGASHVLTKPLTEEKLAPLLQRLIPGFPVAGGVTSQ